MWKGQGMPTTKFNNGKPYHGSDAVTDGKLRGCTDKTDYFYFLCPNCPDQQMLRPLEYEVRAEEAVHPYKDQVDVVAPKGFTLAFKLLCDKCLFTDFIKISNMGWQGGSMINAQKR